MTCDVCGGPMDPAAATDPKDPTRPWTWHPTCRMVKTCACPTPWDEPSRLVIVVGRGKNASRLQTQVTATAGRGLRTSAERAMADLGYLVALDARWTAERVGAQTAWTVPLDVAGSSGTATLTTPLPKGAGQHCDECHLHFANPQAFALHKPDCRQPCRDPRSIRVVGTGRPMLAADADRVWRIDWTSRYPGGVSPMTDSEIFDLREADRLRRAGRPPSRFMEAVQV